MRKAAFLALFLWASAAGAQTVSLQGGISTEYGAPIEGGTIRFYFPNSTDYFSVSSQGLTFAIEHPWRGDTVTAGDQLLSAALPTDYNPQYGYFARGISLRNKKKDSHWMIFAGAAEERTATSFSIAGHAETPLAMATYERTFGDFRFNSYETFSTRQTAIQSLTWKPSDDLKCAASFGIGSNAPLLASLCNVKSTRWAGEAGYTFAGPQFRPIQLSNMIQTFTENTGLNASVSYSPMPQETFSASHTSILAPAENGRGESATVNSGAASKSWGSVFLHGSANEGRNNGTGLVSTGEEAGIGVNLFENKFRATLDFYHSNAGNMETESFTEGLTRHLQAAEYITTQEHRTSMNFGGTYTSNQISGSVYYTTVFDPLLTGMPFQKTMNIRVSIVLGRRGTVTLGTYTTPTGQMKFETFGTSYVEGPYKGSIGGVTRSIHGKYAITGKVVDDTGAGVPGAVVSVGGVDCISDSTGSFTLRVKKNSPAAVVVQTDRFLSGSWKVVAAPAPAMPGTPIRIVVRRI